MRRSIAFVGWLACALATAVVATGCGGGGGGLDGSAVAQAAQATKTARTARVSLTTSVAGQAVHGGGYVDLAGHAAEMSMALPQNQGTIREVFKGTRLYMQVPQSLRKGKLAKKPWVSADINAIAQSKGIDLGALQSQSDPSRSLDQLRAAGQVKKVGTETVRGTQTTHFSAVVDLRKAAAARPPAQRAAAKRSTEALIKQLGRPTFPIDVWLDSQKRVRRERFSIPVQGQQIALTMDLYDFGTSHQVTAPPASQVTDITKQAVAQQPSNP